jgi:hypothetical protein
MTLGDLPLLVPALEGATSYGASAAANPAGAHVSPRCFKHRKWHGSSRRIGPPG